MSEIKKSNVRKKEINNELVNTPAKKKVNKRQNTVKKKEKDSVVNTRVITNNKKKEEVIKKKNRIVILALIISFTLVFLIFLFNKTFFRRTYKTTKLDIDIPIFTYFVNDSDNIITFKSLRKSEYLQQYFDEYLSNLEEFDYYICGNDKAFYYNEDTNLMIFSISVEKKIAIKTIKVYYDVRPPERVCL